MTRTSRSCSTAATRARARARSRPARGLKPRLTHEVTTERPLESYLDGHYSRLRDARQPLFVPTARHILLAACERGQLAQEAPGHGLFTSTLVDVLEKSGGELSYADLFVRCRAAVRSRAFDQDPQFEAYDRFDAGAGFLGRPMTRTSRGRYLAYCDQGAWTVECGAINGVPTEPETAVTLALYPEDDPTTPAGTARAVQVGPQKSEIELDFDSSESARYVAEITSLPAAPMPVAFAGDDETRSAVQDALSQRGVHVSLVGAGDAAGYALTATRRTPGADGSGAGPGDRVRPALAGGTLARAAASLAPAAETGDAVGAQPHAAEPPDGDGHVEGGLRLRRAARRRRRTRARRPGGRRSSYARAGGQWRKIRGRFRVRNRTEQTLSVVLAYFSDAYGVYILGNDSVPAGRHLDRPSGATIRRTPSTSTDGVDAVGRALQAGRRHREGRRLPAGAARAHARRRVRRDEGGRERPADRARSRTRTNGSPGTSTRRAWSRRPWTTRRRATIQQALPFARHHAFIVGIDAYEKVSPLKTAVSDARRAGAGAGREAALRRASARCWTRAATRCARCSRETMAGLVAADDRVLFYFAGHGIAADGDDGPAGYLVPADADPTDLKTLMPMAELQDALQALPCRHLLLDPRLLLLGRLPVGQPDAGHRLADAQAHLQGTVRPVRPRSAPGRSSPRPPTTRRRWTCCRAAPRATAGSPRPPPARRIRRSRWRCSTRSRATPTSAPGAKATA